jgi:hypothetical protein
LIGFCTAPEITMKFPEVTIETYPSFLYFIYPFSFDVSSFESRIKWIEAHQFPNRNFKTWLPQKLVTDDWLVHVADYLNPAKESQRTPTAQFWEMNNALDSTLGFQDAQWQLLTPQGPIKFGFGEKLGEGKRTVQLALFKVGVGFLSLRVQPLSPDSKDWFNFLHYFRFMRGQRGTCLQAQKATWNPQFKKKNLDIFFPEVAGGKSVYTGTPTISMLIEALLGTGESPYHIEPWWEEIFVCGQLIPFAAIFAQGLTEETIPLMLYNLQNFFHEGQGKYPSVQDLDPDCQPWLPYIERMWWIFTLEGGVFLSANPPNEKFFRETLPNHIRDLYFLLFRLVLHQRFTLMMLSHWVAQRWVMGANHRDRIYIFEEIRDLLLLFTARGYFSQVVQREHPHRYYCKWQEVFQLEQLYAEVGDEVRDLHDYVQTQQNQRLQRTIEILGVAIGAGGIAASSISGHIEQPLPWEPAFLAALHPGLKALAFSLIIGAFFAFLAWVWTGIFGGLFPRLPQFNKLRKF